jgi:hypothetical protein
MQQNLMKASPEIQRGKPAGVCKLIHELIEDWYNKFGLHCHVIEVAKIYTEPVSAILLAYQQQRRGERAMTMVKQPLRQHLLHLFFNLVL